MLQQTPRLRGLKGRSAARGSNVSETPAANSVPLHVYCMHARVVTSSQTFSVAFLVENLIFHCANLSSSVSPFGHFGCFQFSTTINSAAVYVRHFCTQSFLVGQSPRSDCTPLNAVNIERHLAAIFEEKHVCLEDRLNREQLVRGWPLTIHTSQSSYW